MRESQQKINQDELIDKINIPSINWSFNPPGASHFRGAWERLIQSVKKTLYGIRFARNPSDEIFRNWLIEVDNAINSRPLTEVSVDREEDAPITPC